MQRDIADKERKLQGVIEELTRKSNLTTNELMAIKE